MTATTSAQQPALEDILERRLPSALARHDEALLASGVAQNDMKETKDAFAALGLLHQEKAPASLRDRLLASRQRKGKF
jgi:hypothetical protein